MSHTPSINVAAPRQSFNFEDIKLFSFGKYRPLLYPIFSADPVPNPFLVDSILQKTGNVTWGYETGKNGPNGTRCNEVASVERPNGERYKSKDELNMLATNEHSLLLVYGWDRNSGLPVNNPKPRRLLLDSRGQPWFLCLKNYPLSQFVVLHNLFSIETKM